MQLIEDVFSPESEKQIQKHKEYWQDAPVSILIINAVIFLIACNAIYQILIDLFKGGYQNDYLAFALYIVMIIGNFYGAWIALRNFKYVLEKKKK